MLSIVGKYPELIEKLEGDSDDFKLRRRLGAYTIDELAVKYRHVAPIVVFPEVRKSKIS